MTLKKKLLSTLIFSCITATSQAALFDHGDGMIYDSELNMIWLQDANYAQTSGYDADGRMTWSEANAWVSQLSYGGYDDWRLPSVGEDPSRGFDITSGELGHMFYNNLGNTTTLDNTTFSNTTYELEEEFETTISSFLNLQSHVYWYSEEFVADSPRAWVFNTLNGAQGTPLASKNKYAWAVRSGDLSPVPIPGAMWLFSSALLALISKKRFN